MIWIELQIKNKELFDSIILNIDFSNNLNKQDFTSMLTPDQIFKE